jgi:DNA-binding transcriptional MerR regulator
MANELLETGQAALVLRLSPFRVRQLADDGTLPVAMRTATGRRLFEPSAVDRLRRQRDRTQRLRRKKVGPDTTEVTT